MRRLVVGGVMLQITLLIVGLTWIVPLSGDDEGQAATQAATQEVQQADAAFRVTSEGTGNVVEVDLVAEETTQTIAERVD